MSALGKVIAAKLMALNQEEKAAVLSFCVGYGVDDALTKSADAALMCLKGGILLPAEHADKCTCCEDYRAKPKKSATFIIQSKGSGQYLCKSKAGVLSFGELEHAIRFTSEELARDYASKEITNPDRINYVKDGGDK